MRNYILFTVIFVAMSTGVLADKVSWSAEAAAVTGGATEAQSDISCAQASGTKCGLVWVQNPGLGTSGIKVAYYNGASWQNIGDVAVAASGKQLQNPKIDCVPTGGNIFCMIVYMYRNTGGENNWHLHTYTWVPGNSPVYREAIDWEADRNQYEHDVACASSGECYSSSVRCAHDTYSACDSYLGVQVYRWSGGSSWPSAPEIGSGSPAGSFGSDTGETGIDINGNFISVIFNSLSGVIMAGRSTGTSIWCSGSVLSSTQVDTGTEPSITCDGARCLVTYRGGNQDRFIVNEGQNCGTDVRTASPVGNDPLTPNTCFYSTGTSSKRGGCFNLQTFDGASGLGNIFVSADSRAGQPPVTSSYPTLSSGGSVSSPALSSPKDSSNVRGQTCSAVAAYTRSSDIYYRTVSGTFNWEKSSSNAEQNCNDAAQSTACCASSTDCVDDGQCFATGSTGDIDADGDVDTCNSGTWTCGTACTCTEWQNGACGGSCPAGQRLQTRSCTPDLCQAESQCVADSSCGGPPPPPPPPANCGLTLYSLADAATSYVNFNQNFGTWDDLPVQKDESGNPHGGVWDWFVKFDTSLIPAGASLNCAELHMRASNTVPPQGTGSPSNLFVWQTSSSWDESTITAQNQPGGSGGSLDNEPEPTAGGSITVFNVLNGLTKGSQSSYTIKYTPNNNGYRRVNFYAKEICFSGNCEPLLKFSCSSGCNQCFDGADNDGDGFVDYPNDPDCSGFTDSTEADTTPPYRDWGYPAGWTNSLSPESGLSTFRDSSSGYLQDATCKYGPLGTGYNSMTLFPATGGQHHTRQFSGLTNGQTVTYSARCQDAAGNTNNDDYQIQFTVDTSLPTGTIVINGATPPGPAYTSSPAVTLHLTYSDAASGVQACRFSNDGTIWSGYMACAATQPWTLAAGDGAKTVHYRVYDNANNFFQTSDTITLDSLGPSVSYTASTPADGTHQDTTFQVGYTMTDAGSGLKNCQYQVEVLNPTTGVYDVRRPFTALGSGSACASGNFNLNVGPASTPSNDCIYTGDGACRVTLRGTDNGDAVNNVLRTYSICIGCQCADIVVDPAAKLRSTESSVWQTFPISVTNKLTKNLNLQFYIKNERDLATCFGRGCGAWDYKFTAASTAGTVNRPLDVTLPAGAGPATLEIRVSGNTPPSADVGGPYTVEPAVRNFGLATGVCAAYPGPV